MLGQLWLELRPVRRAAKRLLRIWTCVNATCDNRVRREGYRCVACQMQGRHW